MKPGLYVKYLKFPNIYVTEDRHHDSTREDIFCRSINSKRDCGYALICNLTILPHQELLRILYE